MNNYTFQMLEDVLNSQEREYHFTNVNLRFQQVKQQTFRNITFTRCDFTGTQFKGCHFLNCEFYACNWGMLNLDGSTTFKGCTNPPTVHPGQEEQLIDCNYAPIQGVIYV